MSEETLNSALNIMRRMPPASTENSLAGLLEMVPQLTEDLLNHVDQPLKVEKDTKSGKSFIQCEYNRDGDSYRYSASSALAFSCKAQDVPFFIRSPWTNKYFPAMDDGFKLSAKLRAMELEANQLFDVYRKLYEAPCFLAPVLSFLFSLL